VNLTIRITDKPCLMPVGVQPVDLETRAVFLAAPAAAALDVENVHVDTATIAVTAVLSSGAAFFENVIVDGIYCPKCFASHFRAWHADPKCFFHAHHQL
jgi:hypothetical protein